MDIVYCKDCVWWVGWVNIDTAGTTRLNVKRGNCHYAPPRGADGWPSTDAASFCAQGQRKETSEVEVNNI